MYKYNILIMNFTNTNTNQYKCGWVNPTNLSYGPQIDSLSSYFSPAGSTTLVSINGHNFYSYSSVSFGTFNPTVYFVNSNILQFYVPSTLNSGIYTIQVFNGSVSSNQMVYHIDNASGFWMAQQGNGVIVNTNLIPPSLVKVTSLSRSSPLTITGNYNFTNANNNPNSDTVNWVVCNATSNITLTLPIGISYSGREIMFKNLSNYSVVSSISNISSLTGNSTNVILPSGIGNWVTLVYNEQTQTWIAMQGNITNY